MEVYRSSWLLFILGFILLTTALHGVQGEVESEGPSESECQPYIEKALKELEATGAVGEKDSSTEAGDDNGGESASLEQEGGEGSDETEQIRTTDAEKTQEDQMAEIPSPEPPKRNMSVIQKLTIMISGFFQKPAAKEEKLSREERSTYEKEPSRETADSGEKVASEEEGDSKEKQLEEGDSKEEHHEEEGESKEEQHEEGDSKEEELGEEAIKEGEEESGEDTAEGMQSQEQESKEDVGEAEMQEASEEQPSEADGSEETTDQASVEDLAGQQQSEEAADESPEQNIQEEEEEHGSPEVETIETREALETVEVTSVEETESKEADQPVSEEAQESAEKEESKEDEQQPEDEASVEVEQLESKETDGESTEKEDSKVEEEESKEETAEEEQEEEKQESEALQSEEGDSKESEPIVAEQEEKSEEGEHESKEDEETTGVKSEENDTQETESKETGAGESHENLDEPEADSKSESKKEEITESEEKSEEQESSDEKTEEVVVEDLTIDVEVPSDLRPREHVEQLLKLDDHSSETEEIVNHISEVTLRELKKLYENAIKPLEVLYKYRDLSNRHFGDAEIFSKPLVLFMGPWSGGKSSIINYLVNNEYNETSLRTGAEPSPAYFNILMYGEEPEILDGTELMADYTFSGLQKFGQGLEERLRGVKLPAKLLEKVNIVEIPGILEVRKQVSRLFPFNDACQWFIDRSDIIFLVYDPSKLDVGPETEAILDQLKGREHQTRIVLNKADQVKPEELMRVQGSLIWNISPLMSSPQPPVMYTVSLWSRPYESWAPVRLLQAQERAFLRDLRGAIDKRIENKIASARRFAVRVRNHAKMVDCYLTTYYNHKSVFGNRKQVAEEIIEHPQNYHIYEGLSTLTNISRYDLPDPDVYRDFFRLNALYEFQQLSATCTYFRGCPINRLDVAIAYDLPELVGTHKKMVENALAKTGNDSNSGQGS